MPNEHDRNDRMGGDQTTEENRPADDSGRDVPPRATASTGEEQPRKKQRRGFAAMDPAKQREIASKGGKASHEQGTGHEWTSDSAREAGRKGGQASHGGRGKQWSQEPGSGMRPGDTPVLAGADTNGPGASATGGNPSGTTGSGSSGGYNR